MMSFMDFVSLFLCCCQAPEFAHHILVVKVVINSPSPLKTFAERRSNKICSCHNISKPGFESQARASEISFKKCFLLKGSVTSLLFLEY